MSIEELTGQLVLWTAIMAIGTVATAVGTIWISVLALKISRRSVNMAQRDERRTFGLAVQQYFDERYDELANGKAHPPLGVRNRLKSTAKQFDYPNTDKLIDWLEVAIDNVKTKDPTPQPLGAHMLRTELRQQIGDWVQSPADYAPEPFLNLQELRKKFEPERDHTGT